ncbi:hypothetical protein FVD38_17945 [Massilia arenae]|uniref:Uncharacterized protein n=2 Tax=Massilia arenae TaxID=2603288 RepID=A0A5C7FSL4_9BURK|nr:hypothetical protein FVD38_17945 [Massilia arenae]
MKTDSSGRNHTSQRELHLCHREFYYLAVFIFIFSIAFPASSSGKPCGGNEIPDFYPVDVRPRIQIIGNVITSRLLFANRGDTPVLVMEGVNGFGLRGSMAYEAQPLMDDEFEILNGDKRVKYIGPIYKRGPYTKDYFSPLQPNEAINMRWSRLDTAYDFAPGTHEYILVHCHLQYDESSGNIFRVGSRPIKFVYTRR